MKGKRVLDLGCAAFGAAHALSTPEFFMEQGAESVVGIDMTLDNLQHIVDPNITLIQVQIDTTEEIANLYKRFSPEVVKCDIEGAEAHLFALPEPIFKTVDEYAVETHYDALEDAAWTLFRHHGYRIKNIIDFIYAAPCKVIHAVR